MASCKAIENNNDLLTKVETICYLVHTNEAYACKLYAYVHKWIYMCTLDIIIRTIHCILVRIYVSYSVNADYLSAEIFESVASHTVLSLQ